MFLQGNCETVTKIIKQCYSKKWEMLPEYKFKSFRDRNIEDHTQDAHQHAVQNAIINPHKVLERYYYFLSFLSI